MRIIWSQHARDRRRRRFKFGVKVKLPSHEIKRKAAKTKPRKRFSVLTHQAVFICAYDGTNTWIVTIIPTRKRKGE